MNKPEGSRLDVANDDDAMAEDWRSVQAIVEFEKLLAARGRGNRAAVLNFLLDSLVPLPHGDWWLSDERRVVRVNYDDPRWKYLDFQGFYRGLAQVLHHEIRAKHFPIPRTGEADVIVSWIEFQGSEPQPQKEPTTDAILNGTMFLGRCLDRAEAESLADQCPDDFREHRLIAFCGVTTREFDILHGKPEVAYVGARGPENSAKQRVYQFARLDMRWPCTVRFPIVLPDPVQLELFR